MTFLKIQLQGIDAQGYEKKYTLSDFKGQKVILYFYPNDSRSGCIQEACDFRDCYEQLKNKAVIVGVSPDSIESHKKLQKKEDLNFILLSDPEHLLSKTFHVWTEKSMYGCKYMGIARSTFLLDEKGHLMEAWRNIRVSGHVNSVLNRLAKIDSPYYWDKYRESPK